MKGLQIPQKLGDEKFYVHEIAAINLSKIYFLKMKENMWTKQPRFKSRLNKEKLNALFKKEMQSYVKQPFLIRILTCERVWRREEICQGMQLWTVKLKILNKKRYAL